MIFYYNEDRLITSYQYSNEPCKEDPYIQIDDKDITDKLEELFGHVFLNEDLELTETWYEDSKPVADKTVATQAALIEITELEKTITARSLREAILSGDLSKIQEVEDKILELRESLNE